MSYTEDDLRATLGELERETPDVADTLTGLERLRRRRTTRRRTAGIAAVAAVTTALAAGSLAVPDLFGADSRETSTYQADGPWRYRFAVDDIPGARVSYRDLRDLEHTAYVLDDVATSRPHTIRVFDKGLFEPVGARAGEPVDVNGKPGFYRDKMPCNVVGPVAIKPPIGGSAPTATNGEPTTCNGFPDVAGVAWEYAPDRWALVVLGDPAPADARAEVLRIARAVRFDRTTEFRVPFRVGYLPAGLEPADGTTYADAGSIGARTYLTGATDAAPRLTIYAGVLPPVDAPVGELKVMTDPFLGPVVARNLGPFTVRVSSGLPDHAQFSEEELTKVARSITVAGDLNDPATWIDAQEAIPTR